MNSRLFLALLAIGGTTVLGACKPDYPKCNTTEDCQADERGGVCVNGTCQECAGDGDCKAGFRCQDNRCVPAVECSSNADCRGGRVCEQGKCVACESDDQCGPNATCVSGACQPKAECQSDADCGEGRSCVDGACQQIAMNCNHPPVRFEFNSYALTDASKSALQQLADCLRGPQSRARVTIEGHADERGSEEYNQALGERRANAVRRFLTNLGVDGGRLTTVSYGEERPLDSSSSESAWAKNRRTEFVLAR